MDELERFKATFFAECVELLGDLESELGVVDAGDADGETLNSIFRAVHSIKAGAGAFKFTALVQFAHTFEALLDRMRNGEVPVIDPVVAVLFRSNDVLATLVEEARDGVETPADFGADVAAELQVLLTGAAAATPAPAAAAAADELADTTVGPERFRVRFAPRPELFLHANEPLLIVRELQTLGPLKATPDLGKLPDIKAMDPEGAYIAWTFEVETESGVEAIEEAFEFVGDDCELEIVRDVQEEAPADDAAAGDDAAADAPVATADAPPPAAPAKAAASDRTAAKSTQVSSIRVDLDRIDRLVNMVGEIVITQSMLSQQTTELDGDRFAQVVRGLEELALHTRDLQESVMAIRMQAVKSVFSRMPRLVRDLSTKLNKKVRLEVSGENTEVDTTVVEEISDPITHMIRNSLDHGLETEADRLAAGKPAEGVIRLSAEHRSGRIVIAIQDDGRGINREKVLAKAKERGVVAPDQTLTDEEIDQLIFAPGFSTATEVTDVSGRGVGMDGARRPGRHPELPGQGHAVHHDAAADARGHGRHDRRRRGREVRRSDHRHRRMPASAQGRGLPPAGWARRRPCARGLHPARLSGPRLQSEERARQSGRGAGRSGRLRRKGPHRHRRRRAARPAAGRHQEPRVELRPGRRPFGRDHPRQRPRRADSGHRRPVRHPRGLRIQAITKGESRMTAVNRETNVDSPAEANAGETQQFVSFTVDKEEYAVDIMQVREIKGWTDVTVLPNQPSYMRGVLNLRGLIVPIVDLRARFGSGPTEATPIHVVVIVAIGERIVGLLVDKVSDILTVNLSEIREVPDMDARDDQAFLRGLVTAHDRLVALLATERLVNAKALTESAAAA